ncbi:hypothetical protein [Roseovarius pacificus]|uniref:hypothetical protein n=1 Tax=Roseovarius pacificus TaxID=337701 RepID=UPI0040395B1B
MSRCPLTAFSTETYLATRNARLGRLTMSMKLKLACVAVALPEGHMPAREAVAQFIDGVDADPAFHADQLDRFMGCWSMEVFKPTAPGFDMTPRDVEFAWQRRKDCGHG